MFGNPKICLYICTRNNVTHFMTETKTSKKGITIWATLSPELVMKLETAKQERKRKTSEIVRDALYMYLENKALTVN